MQIENYLKKYQPVIYKTFVNSLVAKKLSHAYLLVGNPGTPLLETAKFLAKSILCDNPSPLACDNCITCLRIDEMNYADYVLLDGSKNTIKKDDVNNIENQFNKTAFESKGIMIYILHLVENMTTEAVNAILKFLEEPECEIYAFLTTNNENIILPTIVSRCQTMHLKQIKRSEIIKMAKEKGIENKDAELLSGFFNDAELILDFINNEKESELYFSLKDKIDNYFTTIIEKEKRDATYIFQTEIIPLVKNKEAARFIIDIFVLFFDDLVQVKEGNTPTMLSYDTILNGLKDKLTNIDETLVELLKQRSIINTNVNTSLLLDHLNNVILKEA